MPITVKLIPRKGRKYIQAEWVDPVTGLTRSRSTKRTKLGGADGAERFAAKLEEELNSGKTGEPDRLNWEQFTERFLEETDAGRADKTAGLFTTVFNHVAELINPASPRNLRSAEIAKMVNAWRKDELAVATMRTYLTHLKVAIKWAASVEIIPAVPHITMPRMPNKAKGRPITLEEFERMILAAPAAVNEYTVCHGRRACYWPRIDVGCIRLLHGLWLSGLRLGEALNLEWRGDLVRPELEGRHPMFRFASPGQKNRKTELVPMAPEFAEFLEQTPPKRRRGYVFDLPGIRREVDTVSKILTKVGKAANVKVSDRRSKVKFASAHDIRRSFGARWALRVRPAVLQKMMRHASITTTMEYYALLDVEILGDEIAHAYTPQKSHEFTDTFTDT